MGKLREVVAVYNAPLLQVDGGLKVPLPKTLTYTRTHTRYIAGSWY